MALTCTPCAKIRWRSTFCILDALAPLRATAWDESSGKKHSSTEVVLYQPKLTYRLRWPLFYERRQPVGENPPTGAIIYYYLPTVPKGVVALEFRDASGKVV